MRLKEVDQCGDLPITQYIAKGRHATATLMNLAQQGIAPERTAHGAQIRTSLRSAQVLPMAMGAACAAVCGLARGAVGF